MRDFRLWTFLVVVLLFSATLTAQQDPWQFVASYSGNYSSADRKNTLTPSVVAPFSFSFRPTCLLALGIDSDTIVSNKTSTGYSTGVGNLGFEAHFTFVNGGEEADKTCSADLKQSARIDYIVTVPVPGTLESSELGHQIKLTYSKPFIRGNDFLGALTASGGGQINGISSGGTTSNAIASVNYFYNWFPKNALSPWGNEVEVDLASASKLGPSSVIAVLAIDGALDRATQQRPHRWLIRFGLSLGITPYAPKVSPFFTLQYAGSFKKSAVAPSSVLKE